MAKTNKIIYPNEADALQFLFKLGLWLGKQEKKVLIGSKKLETICAATGADPSEVENSIPWYKAQSKLFKARGVILPEVTRVHVVRAGPTSTHCPHGVHHEVALGVILPVMVEGELMGYVVSEPELAVLENNSRALARKINEKYYGPTEKRVTAIIAEFQEAKQNILAAAGAKIEPRATTDIMVPPGVRPTFQLTDGETQTSTMERFQNYLDYSGQQNEAINNNTNGVMATLAHEGKIVDGLLEAQKRSGELQNMLMADRKVLMDNKTKTDAMAMNVFKPAGGRQLVAAAPGGQLVATNMAPGGGQLVAANMVPGAGQLVATNMAPGGRQLVGNDLFGAGAPPDTNQGLQVPNMAAGGGQLPPIQEQVPLPPANMATGVLGNPFPVPPTAANVAGPTTGGALLADASSTPRRSHKRRRVNTPAHSQPRVDDDQPTPVKSPDYTKTPRRSGRTPRRKTPGGY